MLTLVAVPEYALRIRVWAFLNACPCLLERLEAARVDVSRACELLRSSLGVQKLLALILYVGNYLNGGTARGRADGFDIDTLLKVGALKAQRRELDGTLLDYIVRQMEKDCPGLLPEMFERGGEYDVVRCTRR